MKMIAKTPNKRKSFGNAADSQSPKVGKVDSPQQTPGKGKGKGTPGKFNKAPKTPKTEVQQNAKTPKAEIVEKTAQPSPKGKQETPGKKNQKQNKRPNEAGTESGPPKKVKMFKGTSELQGSSQKQQQVKKFVQQKGKGDKKGPARKHRSNFFTLKEKVKSGDKSAIEDVESKLAILAGRKELSKTAKRKLKYLEKMKNYLTGGEQGEKPQSASQKKRERQKRDKGKGQQSGDHKKQVKSEQQKKTETINVKEDAESDSDESAEELDAQIIKVGDAEEEDSDGSEEVEEEQEEDSDEEEEEDTGDEEEEDDSVEEEEQEEPVAPKGKPNKPPQNQSPKQASKDNKKTRYIVFVGNLAYDATKQEISEHFTKAGQIRHIRIPTEIKTNKPRGFAYVEFDDEVSYQKALSLHHTFMKGRRINCLYTQGGKKKGQEKKNEVKAKNFKLQAMRKQGQLAGSVKENQKRSARRAKNAKANGSK